MEDNTRSNTAINVVMLLSPVNCLSSLLSNCSSSCFGTPDDKDYIYIYIIIIKVGRFFVRSLLTRTATDCGQLLTIVNCRVWKETVRLLFTFTGEMAKFRK